jgi:hypothetical protein
MPMANAAAARSIDLGVRIGQTPLEVLEIPNANEARLMPE